MAPPPPAPLQLPEEDLRGGLDISGLNRIRFFVADETPNDNQMRETSACSEIAGRCAAAGGGRLFALSWHAERQM